MVDESFWEALPSYDEIISGTFQKRRLPEKRPIWSEEEAHESSCEEGELSDSDSKKEVKPTKAPVAKKAKSTATKNEKERAPFVPRVVCRYFMDGLCSKGDKCTFSHAVVPNKTPSEARVKDACKFFIAGSCMKGDTCYFSHDLSKYPCKFFHLKGDCAAASKGCRFSHNPISKEELIKLSTAEHERIAEKERANQAIATLKPPASSSSSTSATETRNEPEKATTSKQEMEAHPSLINPFADLDDL